MYRHIAKSFANYIISKNQIWIKNPIRSQSKTLKYLINNSQNTMFGKQHFFKDINNTY